MTYEKLKNIIQEHNKELMLILGFIVVFFVGFGSGQYDKYASRQQAKQQINYTTNKTQQPAKAAGEVKGDAVTTEPAASSTTSKTLAPAECKIKGNISSSKKKIYHMPKGAFYDRTNPEQCFNTEAEAQAAGFVKSSR